jgi:hypothetical protein
MEEEDARRPSRERESRMREICMSWFDERGVKTEPWWNH